MAVSNVTELWQEITVAQTPPPTALVLVAAAVSLLVVGYRPVWRFARNVVTIAHEAGHAVIALLTGRRLSGIRLHADSSGVTLFSGKPRGLGMMLTIGAGYVAPSLLGLGGAALLGFGHITALLWVCVAQLALMLVILRNFYGLAAVLATGGVVFVVTWYADTRVQAVFAYLVVWFLLFGGVRPVFELQRQRRRGQAAGSDADQLAHLTRLPGVLWVGVFAVVAIAAMLCGGLLLVAPDLPALGELTATG